MLRHSTAHVTAQAVCDLYPGAKYAIGPAIEDGFTTTSTSRSRSTRPTSRRSTGGCGRSPSRTSRSCAKRCRATWRGARLADQPFKVEIIDGLEEEESARGGGDRGRHGQPVSQRRVGRPLHGAARAAHGQARRLQADEPGGRVLAGRRVAPDAHADLRHGVGDPAGPRRPSGAGRGGGAAGSSAPGGRARPLLLPRRDRLGPGGVPPAGWPDPPADGGLLCAVVTWRRGTSS